MSLRVKDKRSKILLLRSPTTISILCRVQAKRNARHILTRSSDRIHTKKLITETGVLIVISKDKLPLLPHLNVNVHHVKREVVHALQVKFNLGENQGCQTLPNQVENLRTNV